MAAKPPAVVDLAWNGRLEFNAKLSKSALVVDSAGVAGPSPVELLATALAGCMAVDVAFILARGRQSYRSFATRLVAERAPDQPHRVTAVSIHFAVAGSARADAVSRAIELSRDKYCSVWHSLRQDIDLQVTFDVSA